MKRDAILATLLTATGLALALWALATYVRYDQFMLRVANWFGG